MSFGLQSLLDKDLYQSYLHRLDARALLEHYGARNCTEQSGGDGTVEIVHSCLLDRVERHHTNGDEHPSACVNVDRRLFVCYALGFGCDLFHLVQKLEGLETFADALGAVAPFLTGATVEGSALRAELEKLFAAPAAYGLELPSYSERILDSWATSHPYWWHRGIDATAIAALRLGFDPHESRIVFPHFVDGKLVGWQKRVVPGLTRPPFPKYRNSSGFPKSETLYHLDTARGYDRVCVVESPMSVARAVTLGLPNVVATFGAKVSRHQIDALKRFAVVYVWFDADPAGAHGTEKIVSGLWNHTQVLVVTPDGGRDMGDADLDEIAGKLAQAVPAALLGGISRGRAES